MAVSSRSDITYTVAKNDKGGAELYINLNSSGNYGVLEGAMKWGQTSLLEKLGSKFNKLGPKGCIACTSGWDLISIGKIRVLPAGREVIAEMRLPMKDLKQMVNL